MHSNTPGASPGGFRKEGAPSHSLPNQGSPRCVPVNPSHTGVALIMKRKKLELSITVLTYVCSAMVSSLLAISVLGRFQKLTEEFLGGNLFFKAYLPLLAAVLFAQAVTLFNRNYRFHRMGMLRCFGKSLLNNLVIGGFWAIVLLISKNSITESRYYFVATLAINLILLSVLLYVVQRETINRFHKTDSASICAIMTTRARAPFLTDAIKNDWYRRVEAVILTDQEEAKSRETDARPQDHRDDGGVEYIDHVPVVATLKNGVSWIRENALDEVFVVVDDTEKPEILEAVKELEQMGLRVSLNLASVERVTERLKLQREEDYRPAIERELMFFGDTPFLLLGPREIKMRYLLMKRILDILGALFGLLICGVLFLFTAPAILLESPGPVFFAQERIGKNGRKFKMYKFRSMYRDAEERKQELMKQNEMNGLMFKMKDDPRITKVGRFIRRTSIDEFPQFYNVLKGDMSLVGTRPPTVGEFKQYSNYHKRRLSMKPGITGIWQVSGRSDVTDFEEIVRLDCSYIDNWSLGLDLKILARTVLIVLRHEGAR